MLLAVLATCALLAGCSLHMPSDPDGTLDRVSGGTLHVGASPNGNLVTVDEAGTGDDRGPRVGGSEAELVRGFADELGAHIEWTASSEEALVRGLEAGSLDLVIGGITDQTPWAERAGMTRPYAEAAADDGGKQHLVMLTPLGENAFLSRLERYLDQQAETP